MCAPLLFQTSEHPLRLILAHQVPALQLRRRERRSDKFGVPRLHHLRIHIHTHQERQEHLHAPGAGRNVRVEPGRARNHDVNDPVPRLAQSPLAPRNRPGHLIIYPGAPLLSKRPAVTGYIECYFPGQVSGIPCHLGLSDLLGPHLVVQIPH